MSLYKNPTIEGVNALSMEDRKKRAAFYVKLIKICDSMPIEQTDKILGYLEDNVTWLDLELMSMEEVSVFANYEFTEMSEYFSVSDLVDAGYLPQESLDMLEYD